MRCLVVLFALVATGACSRQQHIIIYDEENQRGNSYNISNMNTHKLKSVGNGWDKRIVSAKITGIYLFYDEEWFDASDPNSGVRVAWGQGVSINLGSFSRKASSLRHVGESKNWKMDTIVFFQKDGFRGQNLKIYWSVDDLIQFSFGTHFWSVIVTGDSAWTVYSQKNFTGDELCLHPGDSGSPGLFWNESFLEDKAGRMLSARKGCLGVTQASSHQHIIIYDKENQAGNFYNISDINTPQLKLVDDGWDKRIVSVKLTGIYLFYDEEYFDARDPNSVYVAWGQDVSINLGDFSRRASSLRYVGESDHWKSDRIVLFEKDGFRGHYLRFYGSSNDVIQTTSWPYDFIQFPFRSAIVTGYSAWTVYTKKNFKGDKFCFHPGNSGSPGVFRKKNLEDMSGRMRSIKKGCHSNKKSLWRVDPDKFHTNQTLGKRRSIVQKAAPNHI